MTPKQKRAEMKRILPKLTDGQRGIFMRMYSPFDLDKDINEVVDELPTHRVNRALEQVLNTYHRIFRILKSA